MALKLRKEIKKSSYYVWFLGAKESKGLRGIEYIIPVIKHLEEREKDVEPFKVTLQVSNKGLKIIQNIIVSQQQNNGNSNSNNSNGGSGKSTKSKNETIKHFIPHNTITSVYQHEDIIACILLLFNPITKCPLHVHAYRCDSLETAGILKQQLQLLIDKPDNQKKFNEIETRLKLNFIKENNNNNNSNKNKFDSSLGSSDTGTSTRESESSEERYGNDTTRVETLYDSVAAELREKLGKNDVPILLPPRDYDTVHRQKGNLTGIELRRCLNTNIVGQNVVKGARRIESSGGSSGIGSDHPPSPESPEVNERFNSVDNQSTSDEDWIQNPTDSTLYLMNHNNHHHHQVTLPRPSRHNSESDNNNTNNNSNNNNKTSGDLIKPEKHFGNNFANTRYQQQSPQKLLCRNKSNDEISTRFSSSSNANDYENKTKSSKYNAIDSSRYVEERNSNTSRRYRQLQDDGGSNGRYDTYNREEYERRDKNHYDDYKEREGGMFMNKYDDDEEVRSKGDRYGDVDGRYYDDDELRMYHHHREVPVPKIRQKYVAEEVKSYGSSSKRYDDDEREFTNNNNNQQQMQKEQLQQRYIEEMKRKQQKMLLNNEEANGRYYGTERSSNSNKSSNVEPKQRQKYASNTNRKNAPETRQRSPSPAEDVTPRDRFKDAKEKFLLLEKERLEQERKLRLDNHRENKQIGNHLRRTDSMTYHQHHHHQQQQQQYQNSNNDKYDRYEQEREKRYYEDRGYEFENKPKPAPRSHHSSSIEEIRFRNNQSSSLEDTRFRNHQSSSTEEVRFRRDAPIDRYRSHDKYDPKRRSMFSLIEEEHRKNSNEIAKELKRRSYMDNNNYEDEYFKDRSYQELPESERYQSGNGTGNGGGNHHHPQQQHQLEREYDYRFTKSSVDIDKIGGGGGGGDVNNKYDGKYLKNQQKIKSPSYRHSYAEPKIRIEQNNKKYHHHHPELLHRTNSSVSNNGRVGIASVHPY